MDKIKKRKILVLSSFPAPYRVDVFKGLADFFDLDVFFGTDKDQNRCKDYFISKNLFHYNVITNAEDEANFNKCLKQLDSYGLVLAYDWYLPFAMKAELKCIGKRIPYIINCDGAFIKEASGLKGMIMNKVKRYFISNASKCFASGMYAKKYFEYYGAQPENILIHNFTSLHEDDILGEPVSQQEKEEIRIELGLKNRKTVLSIGQFIYRKGFDVLLEAWGDTDKYYQLVMIGGGEEKVNYQSIIQNYNYENVVLIDFMTKEKIFQYYKASDLFVLATREDIWGLVINEAMACGLPVITTDKCIAASELIEDGVNGYIVPSENSIKINYLMNKVLSDKNFAQMDNITKISNYVISSVVDKHCKYILEVLR